MKQEETETEQLFYFFVIHIFTFGIQGVRAFGRSFGVVGVILPGRIVHFFMQIGHITLESGLYLFHGKEHFNDLPQCVNDEDIK